MVGLKSGANALNKLASQWARAEIFRPTTMGFDRSVRRERRTPNAHTCRYRRKTS
jgi:hypothetical protein